MQINKSRAPERVGARPGVRNSGRPNQKLLLSKVRDGEIYLLCEDLPASPRLRARRFSYTPEVVYHIPKGMQMFFSKSFGRTPEGARP